MNDMDIARVPAVVEAILTDTERIGFAMMSERQTGSLLRTLAASKPGGCILEIGTGTGVGTAWLLAGMDAHARLESIDNNPAVQDIARRHLGADPRVTFHAADAAAFLQELCRTGNSFDLIFGDAWPGKYSHLDLALSGLRVGGVYVVDDLLPQPNWPEGHAANVPVLLHDLERRPEFVTTRLAWSSGLLIAVRTHS